jgi:hypothetical protein
MLAGYLAKVYKYKVVSTPFNDDIFLVFVFKIHARVIYL